MKLSTLLLTAHSALFAAAFSLVSYSAFAAPTSPVSLGGRHLAPNHSFLSDDVADYQIGDVWGKLPLARLQVQSASGALQKAAKATARYSGMFGGATGFYMGKFNGEHVMGTNYHVVDGVGCSGVKLTFPFLGTNGTTVKCKRIIGKWTDIDFGMIVLDIPANLETTFENVGVNFAFETPIDTGWNFSPSVSALQKTRAKKT